MSTKNTSRLDINQSIGYWFWGLARVSAILFLIYAMPRISSSNPWAELAIVFGAVSAVIVTVVNAFYYFVQTDEKGIKITLWKQTEASA